MSLLTRDMQNLSTAAGQVIHNFLKEGDAQRFSRDDLIRICCVLTTAEYCLETVQQLEEKLKEKVAAAYVSKVDMSEEKDVFHRYVINLSTTSKILHCAFFSNAVSYIHIFNHLV